MSDTNTVYDNPAWNEERRRMALDYAIGMHPGRPLADILKEAKVIERFLRGPVKK